MSPSIFVVGLNHASAPLAIRERLTYTDPSRTAALESLKQQYAEVVILDTCQRSEVYAVVRAHGDTPAALGGFLANFHGLQPQVIEPFLYIHAERAAVAHLFAIASGIDSVVIGETEILSQVRAALAIAEQHEACGGILSALYRRALHAGKRARAETGIARGATSLSSLAIECARAELGSLAGARALIIGAGKMSTLAARRLRFLGANEIYVCSRTPAHAQQLAHEIDAVVTPFERISEMLASCDIVFTATAAPHLILTHDMVGAAMRGRTRPLCIIDLALPRDVEPTVGRLPGVHFLDLNDVQARASTQLEQRRAEICAVRGIIRAEVDAFWQWLQALSVMPTIVALRERAEEIRRGELADHLGRLPQLSEHDRRIIETMTASIVGRLLYEPTLRLKRHAGEGAGGQYAATLRELFALDEESE